MFRIFLPPGFTRAVEWSVDLLGQLAIYKNAHLPFQSSVCWATFPLGWNLFGGTRFLFPDLLVSKC